MNDNRIMAQAMAMMKKSKSGATFSQKQMDALIKQLQTAHSNYMKVVPANWRQEDDEEMRKKAEEVAFIDFMQRCFNLTTDFTKCDYCEFRFRCFTEVKKDADNRRKRKRKITKKKVTKGGTPPRGGIIYPTSLDRLVIKDTE